jgi:hypothetical protein
MPAVPEVPGDVDQAVRAAYAASVAAGQPSAIADPAEDLAGAAARQVLAESGWEPIEPLLLLTLELNRALTDFGEPFPLDQACHISRPGGSGLRGRADRVDIAKRRPALIADSRIRAACTVAALLLLYHTGPG